MDGCKKIAILLLALDPKVAGDLLSRFDDEQRAEIVRMMLAMQYLDDDTVRSVLDEFGQLWGEEHDAVTEPRTRAKSILENAMKPEEAEAYLGQHDPTAGEGDPFAPLERLEAAQLATLLADEHAQTVAIVLARIEPKKAGQVLAQLPQEMSADIVRRMVTGAQGAPATVVQSVARALTERSRTLAGGDPWASPRTRFALVAKILSSTTRVTREAALGSVREQDPEVGEAVRNQMFLFEDIPLLSAEALRKVVGAVDTQTIAMALKTATDETKEAIFNVISKRAAQTIREEQELLGPKPLSEVEAAQQAIVDLVNKLASDGEITIKRGAALQEELV